MAGGWAEGASWGGWRERRQQRAGSEGCWIAHGDHCTGDLRASRLRDEQGGQLVKVRGKATLGGQWSSVLSLCTRRATQPSSCKDFTHSRDRVNLRFSY